MNEFSVTGVEKAGNGEGAPRVPSKPRPKRRRLNLCQ